MSGLEKSPLEDVFYGLLLPTPSYGLSNEGKAELIHILSDASIYKFRVKESLKLEVREIITKLHGYIWAVAPSGQRTALDNQQFQEGIDWANKLTINNRILLDKIFGVGSADKLDGFGIESVATKQKQDKQYLVKATIELCRKYKIKYQSGDNIPARLMTLIAKSANMPLNKNTIKNLIDNSLIN